jgi:hypothetical protein
MAKSVYSVRQPRLDLLAFPDVKGVDASLDLAFDLDPVVHEKHLNLTL